MNFKFSITNFLKNTTLILVFWTILAGFGTLAYVIQSSQDAEVQLKNLLVDENNSIIQAFFSPDHDLRSMLVDLINSEKEQISVAIYTITHKDIANALIRAHNRGVYVECIVDRSYGTERFSKIPNLANSKIPIWVFQPVDQNYALMHNKFMIFKNNILDKSILWTGSFNFTNKACNSNQENVIILDNKSIISKYSNQFSILKKRSLLISGKPKKQNNKKNKSNKSKQNSLNKQSRYYKQKDRSFLELLNLYLKSFLK